MKEIKSEPNFKKYIELIRDTKTCMMITDEKDDDYLSGKPLAICEVDTEGSIWFFTKETFFWIDELEENKTISLVIINPANNNYVMVHGKASISDDKSRINGLWNDSMKDLYPKGLEDPSLILIAVKPEEVRHWEHKSSNMNTLISLPKTDELESDEGEKLE